MHGPRVKPGVTERAPGVTEEGVIPDPCLSSRTRSGIHSTVASRRAKCMDPGSEPGVTEEGVIPHSMRDPRFSPRAAHLSPRT
jgi:hypothetical protein